MSEEWSQVATEVAAGLMEAGAPAAIITQAYDPDRPPYDPGPPIPTSHPVTAVEIEFSFKELNGGSIEVGDIKVMMTDPGFQPSTAMTFSWAGGVWQIENWDRLAPGGQIVIFYTLHLRA